MSYKLPQGVKKAWVQALRSGEYQQGTGWLLCGGGYCCLGVLADCAGLLDGAGRFDGRSGAALVGRDDVPVIPPKIQTTLANMNDSDGATFDEIADWIEEHL